MTPDSSPSPFVLAFGDSLTAGYGLTREQSFASRLEIALRKRHPGARVHNAGVSGDTTTGGRARLARVLAALPARPDLAILQLGANDVMRGHPTVQTRENMAAMLVELGRCRIPVVLAGMVAPPFLGTSARAFNAIYADLARDHAATLYPFFLDGVALRPGLTLADGFHPNARAIEIVTERILPTVERALAAATAARAA
ncbi:MAG: arylesterase [Pseudomonadota bacterium]